MFNANEFETIFSNCSNGTESYSLEYTLFADFRYKCSKDYLRLRPIVKEEIAL